LWSSLCVATACCPPGHLPCRPLPHSIALGIGPLLLLPPLRPLLLPLPVIPREPLQMPERAAELLPHHHLHPRLPPLRPRLRLLPRHLPLHLVPPLRLLLPLLLPHLLPPPTRLRLRNGTARPARSSILFPPACAACAERANPPRSAPSRRGSRKPRKKAPAPGPHRLHPRPLGPQRRRRPTSAPRAP
jgi:hypothetical protein